MKKQIAILFFFLMMGVGLASTNPAGPLQIDPNTWQIIGSNNFAGANGLLTNIPTNYLTATSAVAWGNIVGVPTFTTNTNGVSTNLLTSTSALAWSNVTGAPSFLATNSFLNAGNITNPPWLVSVPTNYLTNIPTNYLASGASYTNLTGYPFLTANSTINCNKLINVAYLTNFFMTTNSFIDAGQITNVPWVTNGGSLFPPTNDLLFNSNPVYLGIRVSTSAVVFMAQSTNGGGPCIIGDSWSGSLAGKFQQHNYFTESAEKVYREDVIDTNSTHPMIQWHQDGSLTSDVLQYDDSAGTNPPAHRLRIDYAGNIIVNGNPVGGVSVPAATNSPGSPGQVVCDSSSNVYLCLSSNNWQRASLSLTGWTNTSGGGGFPTDGLIAYWSFDNSSDPAGMPSQGGTTTYTLTPEDGTPSIVAGKIANGIQTTYGSYSMSDNASPVIDTTGTITVWVKQNSTASGWRQVVGECDGGRNHFCISFQDVTPNRINFQCSGDGGWPPIAICTSVDFTDHQWHFVAAQISDQQFYRIKVDNGDWTTCSMVGWPHLSTMSAKALEIGRNVSQGMGLFDGEIDEIGIYNRLLSDDELTGLFNGGSGQPSTF